MLKTFVVSVAAVLVLVAAQEDNQQFVPIFKCKPGFFTAHVFGCSSTYYVCDYQVRPSKFHCADINLYLDPSDYKCKEKEDVAVCQIQPPSNKQYDIDLTKLPGFNPPYYNSPSYN